MTSAMFERPAAAYDRYVGRYGAELAAALCERAGIAAPMRALDVGCGTGLLTAHLAGLLGVGNVAAVDPSPPFLAAARARVPGVDARQATAEDLPYADGEFDAALAQLVVAFMADAVRGVGEMRRVTRPGGVVAACTWDYAGEMRMLRAFWDAVRAAHPDSGAARDENSLPYADESSLRRLWEQVGLRDVTTGALVASARYDSFADLWEPFTQGVGPAGAYTVSLEPAARDALRDDYRRRLSVPDGPFELTARAWYVVGVV